MIYKIEFSKGAAKAFKALSREWQHRLDAKIQALAVQPRPAGSIKMSGASESYRLRIGEYRVVYDIHDRQLIVIVLRLGHRREIYRGL